MVSKAVNKNISLKLFLKFYDDSIIFTYAIYKIHVNTQKKLYS